MDVSRNIQNIQMSLSPGNHSVQPVGSNDDDRRKVGQQVPPPQEPERKGLPLGLIELVDEEDR